MDFMDWPTLGEDSNPSIALFLMKAVIGRPTVKLTQPPESGLSMKMKRRRFHRNKLKLFPSHD